MPPGPAESPVTSGGVLARLRPHLAKLVASLVIAAGFVWMFRRGGLPFFPSRETLSHVRWWCVPAYMVCVTASAWLRTYRWIYLLRAVHEDAPRGAKGQVEAGEAADPHGPSGRLDAWRVLGIGLVGYGIILFAPLRMGELARPLIIARDGEISFTQATGTVAAERIIDGLLVSLILLVGVLWAHPLDPLPDHLGKLPLPLAAVPRATYAALALFTCAFAAMGLFYWAREFARRLVHGVVGIVSEKLATWLTDKVERVADGLSFLPSRAHGGPFFRDTLAYWAVAYFTVFVGVRGVGIPVTAIECATILGLFGLGILIPSGPGFFGAYQLSSYCALAMFFPESVVLGAGAAFVFVSYTCQLGITLLSMGVGALLMRHHPAHPAAAALPRSTPAAADS